MFDVDKGQRRLNVLTILFIWFRLVIYYKHEQNTKIYIYEKVDDSVKRGDVKWLDLKLLSTSKSWADRGLDNLWQFLFQTLYPGEGV